MIPVRLSRLVMRDGSDQQWIFLKEREGERGFPIVIGTPEAHEIHRVITRQAHPRPLTHQLTYDTIGALGAKLVRVDIVDLRENTFFARLILSTGEEDGAETQVDARPSDALALGLRAGCPIRVAESVLEQARTDISGPDALKPEDQGPPEPTDPPDDDPEQLG